MIPYEELAAALERRARPSTTPASAQTDDATLSGNEGDHLEVGEVLSDEEAS
jgi:hypothetical protein